MWGSLVLFSGVPRSFNTGDRGGNSTGNSPEVSCVISLLLTESSADNTFGIVSLAGLLTTN